jgi:hypothetical protein
MIQKKKCEQIKENFARKKALKACKKNAMQERENNNC